MYYELVQNADKGGRVEGQKPENFADVICTCLLRRREKGGDIAASRGSELSKEGESFSFELS